MSSSNLILLVKRITPGASLPFKQHTYDAGYDLASSVDCIIPAHSSLLVPTGLEMAIPEGHYGRIASRSGLAWKNKIDVAAGVIDAGYRKEVGVLLRNGSDADFQIKKGDRIAQLIIEVCKNVMVTESLELPSSDRSGGFGSTGISSSSSSSN